MGTLKRRFTRNRVIAIALCFLMAAAIVPLVVFTTAPKAEAYTATVNSWSALTTAAENADTDIVINLSGNLTVTSQLTILGNKNVTINLGNYNITRTYDSGSGLDFNNSNFEQDVPSGARYSMAAALEFFTFGYKGSTNKTGSIFYIFSIPSTSTLTITGSGEIKSTSSDGISSNNNASLYNQVRTIYNEGTLNIEGGKITAYAQYHISGGYAHGAASIAVAIYNNGGTVNVKGGNITATSSAQARASSGDNAGNGWSFAAGIYNPPGTTGRVNISGGYHPIKAYNNCTYRDTPYRYDLQNNALAVGVDLNDSAACIMTGGSIDIETTLWHNNAGGALRDAEHANFTFGIHHTGNNYPTITGTGPNIMSYPWHQTGTNSGTCTDEMGFAVAKTPTSCTDANTNSYFRDEYGVLQQSVGYDWGTNPFQSKSSRYTIKNGWIPDQAKMLHYYRVFEGPDKTYPLGDTQAYLEMSDYMKARMNDVVFGNKSGALITKNQALSATQSSKNDNYYYFGGFDYDVRDNSSSSASIDPAPVTNLNPGTSVTAGGSMPYPGEKTLTLVYVNIFKKLPLEAKLNVAGQSLERDYKGSAFVPNDLGIAFLNTADNSDVSGRFNVDGGTDASKSRVTYSYSGTSGGQTVSGSGLPTNAGTYTITVAAPDTTAYSEAITLDAGHNIKGFTATFTLTINKANPIFTPASEYKMTYGNSLDSVGGLGTATYSIDNGNNTGTLPATITWKDETATSAPYEKNAGTYDNKTLVITPNDTVNYNTIERDVTLIIERKPITIILSDVTKTFGDTPAGSPAEPGMSASLASGYSLAPFDNWDNAVIGYKFTDSVLGGGWWTGEVGDYTYNILGIDGVCALQGGTMDGNYAITCLDADFKVAPKAVTATPVPAVTQKTYDGVGTIDITFTLSGLLAADEGLYSVTPGTIQGTYDPNAGTQNVTYDASACTLTGPAAANYVLAMADTALTIKINPKELTVTPVLAVTEKDYDGDDTVDISFTISGFLTGHESSHSISPTTVQGSYNPNVGTQAVTFDKSGLSLSGPYADDYKLVIGNASAIKINKINPEILTLPAVSDIYLGQALSASILSDGLANVPGAFSWTNASIKPSATGSQEYSVTFTPSDTVNYNVITLLVQLNVTEVPSDKELIINAGIDGKLMVGETVSASVELYNNGVRINNLTLMSKLQYQWIRLDGENADEGTVVGTKSTYKFTDADAGYYFKLVVSVDDATYGEREGVARTATSVTATAKLTFWQKLIAWINSIIQAFQFLK